MRIAINAYFLQQPATGSGEHIYSLLEGLDGIDEPNDYLVLYPRLTRSQITRLPLLGPRFHVLETRAGGVRLGARWGKLWWEQIALRRACATHQVDLLHSPYFASPLTRNVPTVVTVHDVIPLILPRYGSSFHSRLYMKLASEAARHAEALITVSEASKRDIVKTLRVPADRVHVIHNAVDAGCRPVFDESALDGLRDAYGIGGDFLLYLGGFDERKNVERIVRAFHAAVSSFERPCQLVLAGSLGLVGHPLYPDPRPLLRQLGLEKDVIVTGRISEEEKPVLYSAATAFVFPSLYEGFGIPVLEAMACGAPVITSNSSSLPEVVGDAALLVDPTSLESITEAMAWMINDSGLREVLRRRGIERASQFSWEASARKTIEVYRQVVR